MFQIRKADDNKYHYLVEIYKDGSERVVADTDSMTLKKLKTHPEIKGSVKVIAEKETRGKTPRKQVKGK